jgi:hypothetical protein
MTKIITVAFLLLANVSLSQYKGTLITQENDTILVKIKFDVSDYNVNRLMYLQDEIITFRNNEKKIYVPAELKSFTIDINYKLITFDNINDTYFAERLYLNNVRLNKLVMQISHGHTIRYYIIKRPNQPIKKMIPALGLSNLITKKAMLKEIDDCKISYDKINNNEYKIKDEDYLIEFVKDFEKNCYPK